MTTIYGGANAEITRQIEALKAQLAAKEAELAEQKQAQTPVLLGKIQRVNGNRLPAGRYYIEVELPSAVAIDGDDDVTLDSLRLLNGDGTLGNRAFLNVRNLRVATVATPTNKIRFRSETQEQFNNGDIVEVISVDGKTLTGTIINFRNSATVGKTIRIQFTEGRGQLYDALEGRSTSLKGVSDTWWLGLNSEIYKVVR